VHQQHALSSGKVIAGIGEGAVHHSVDGSDQAQVMHIQTREPQSGAKTFRVRSRALRLSCQ
jgi:hypothetical protein